MRACAIKQYGLSKKTFFMKGDPAISCVWCQGTEQAARNAPPKGLLLLSSSQRSLLPHQAAPQRKGTVKPCEEENKAGGGGEEAAAVGWPWPSIAHWPQAAAATPVVEGFLRGVWLLSQIFGTILLCHSLPGRGQRCLQRPPSVPFSTGAKWSEVRAA